MPGALLAVGVAADDLSAQVRGDAPMAPAATIGPVTDAPTFSVLGIASLPDGRGNSLAQRNDVWLGATQSAGRIGRVRFAALASGNMQLEDGTTGGAQSQGLLTLRARTRVGENRIWSAVSYGRASVNGKPASGVYGDKAIATAWIPMATAAEVSGDTTITRRLDAGQLARAEAGFVTTYAGIEFAFGVSYEHASRVTTQRMSVDVPRVGMNVPSGAGQVVSSSLRTVQRRDLTTGIAAVGFNTGQTQWLVSVTAPVTSWTRGDALAPQAQAVPSVASVAVVQPITGWLSLVGAAASNAATLQGSMLRDELRTRANTMFSPVVALGVRLSRLPWNDGDGTPTGILAFETRTLGNVDSISIERAAAEAPDVEPAARDTMRVVLLIDAPRAESVELMGDATQWSVTRMRRLTSGRWRAELKLPVGAHRLTVRADGGQWIAPPGLPIANDEFGSPVGLLIVRR